MTVTTARQDPEVMHQRRPPAKAVLGKIALYIVIAVVALALALPFLWMIGTSLKSDLQVIALPPEWWPSPFRWDNYKNLFTANQLPFGRWVFNSVVVVCLAVLGQLLSTSLVGFAFGRLQWMGRKYCFALLIATMMLPGQVTIIPLYIFFSKIGWVNTWYPLIIPSWLALGAFYVFLFRQFMFTLPRELDDAARMDGCNTWQLYWRVIMPLCKPVIAAVTIFSFQSHWNEFFGPLIYITDNKMQLLAVGITYLTQQVSPDSLYTPWNLLMAAAIIMTLPMVVIFFTAQRVFVQGVVFSGLKA